MEAAQPTQADRRVFPSIRWRRIFSESPIAGPLVSWIAIIIFFSIFVPNFAFTDDGFTWRSFTGILNASVLAGTVAIGVTMLMIAGEFDLSVGPLMAMGGYLYANVSQGRLHGNIPLAGPMPVLALVLAILVPTFFGMLNGMLVIGTKIPSFIVTLGTRSIYRGMVWIYSLGLFVEAADRTLVYDIFNSRIDDLLNRLFGTAINFPRGADFRTAMIWVFLLVLLFEYLLMRTRYGNHVFATGGNRDAAAAQGVKVKQVKVINFALSGACAGFAGVLLFSQFTRVQVATGGGFELTAIAAAVVGGTLLAGGSGRIWGALIGVLLISTLRTGVILMGPGIQDAMASLQPVLGDFLTNFVVGFTKPDNFEAIVGITIVAAAILNNWLRNRA